MMRSKIQRERQIDVKRDTQPTNPLYKIMKEFGGLDLYNGDVVVKGYILVI